ncbi:MAG: ADP-heptose--lipooligosaccharide heptosyltransferase [Thermoleophilia bacterium]|nr:ADP-heptose--lipooligosaccharide heptosyltransferase [Thermoleophilia bacterium]
MEDDVQRDAMVEFGPGPEPAGVRELLAVRPGGLGDVVRAVPALRHLRATYPDARISVAARASARDLLETCPYVDRTIDLAAPSEALLERFDVVISFARPGAAGELDVADVRAGFRVAWSLDGSGDRGGIRPAWTERLPDSTRMLRLAWLLGGALGADTTLGLWPSLGDRNGAARLVDGITRPIALVHVGASGRGRSWPSERWSRVLDTIDAAGLEPVLVGTARDRAAADAAAAGATVNATSLVGSSSVGELVGLLERAALFVGGDSGPAALAGAIGVRSIVVAPSSSLEHEARPGLMDLVDAGACERCGERVCPHPIAPAVRVALEPVLARVERAAATALARWTRAQIA